ncbi:MAG: TetR/AcrR family transcriptional regulator [Janthinobacterium lividum]
MAERRPRGSRREQSTEETRRLILSAALQEFGRRGYAGTTAADVATAAGVSVATVYTSVGTKPVLLETLVRQGVQDAQVEQTIQAVAVASTGREVLEAVAHGTRTTSEAYQAVIHLLLDNPRAEPGVTALMQDVHHAYRRALDTCVERLEELGALRPDTTASQARAAFWLLFGLHAWPGLVRDLDWDYDAAEAWLLAAAERTLLQGPR